MGASHEAAYEEVPRRLSSDPERGLSEEEAGARLVRLGPNRLERAARPAYPAIALRQFADPLVAIHHGPRVTFSPTSVLGRWAVGLAAAFFPLVFAAAVVPRGAALGFVCGVAGGAAGLLAIIRDRERAVTCSPPSCHLWSQSLSCSLS